MKKDLMFSARPYQPLHLEKSLNICAVCPDVNAVSIEWVYDGREKEFTISVATLDGKKEQEITTQEKSVTIDNLTDGIDYCVTVKAKNSSDSRLFVCGDYVGRVVNYLHKDDDRYSFSGKFLCSPSIVEFRDKLYASMDVYKMHGAQNLSILMSSSDKGESWQYVTDLFPCFWGTLFVYDDKLCIIATSTEYGDLLVSQSSNGKDFCQPIVLKRGSSNHGHCGVHKSAVPIYVDNDRLYIALEWGAWEDKSFSSFFASIKLGDDIMNVDLWTLSDLYRHEKDATVPDTIYGGIEGNVIGLSGDIYIVLRYYHSKALVLKYDKKYPEKAPTFCRYIDFAPAHSKFCIKQHTNGKFYAVGNLEIEKRNILALFSSTDVFNWKLEKKLIDKSEFSHEKVGFQYPDFIFDKDEILCLSRTGYNGASTFHDTNCITFHKFKLD